MTTDATLRDRMSGALYGLLVGDALGCPVEGMAADEIATRYGVVDKMQEGEKWWRPAGLHSDDGQQAIALLDALLEDPIRPVRPFARNLVELRRQGPGGFRRFGLHRGTGGNFRTTVMALGKDPALDATHAAEDALFAHATVTAGNGAAMRVAPLALFFRDDLDALLSGVIRTGRVTHADTRGLAAAAAVAWMVRTALDLPPAAKGERIFSRVDVGGLLAFVRRAEEQCIATLPEHPHRRGMSEVLTAILPSFDDDIPALCEKIVDVCGPQSDRRVGAGAGFAPASVTLSLCVALAARSFEQALIDVISAGDDTDTTAAMVGQMVGAATGRKEIPSAWMNALWARGTLEDRIDAVMLRRVPFRPGFSLVELETPWTEALYRGEDERSGRRRPSTKAIEDVDLHERAFVRNDDADDEDIEERREEEKRLPPSDDADDAVATAAVEVSEDERNEHEGNEDERNEDDDDDVDDEPFWMTMDKERAANDNASTPPIASGVPAAPAAAAPAAAAPAAAAPAAAAPAAAAPAAAAPAAAAPAAAAPAAAAPAAAAPAASKSAKPAAPPPAPDDSQLSIFDVAPARTIGRPRESFETAPKADEGQAVSTSERPAAKDAGPALFAPLKPAPEPEIRDEVILPSGTKVVLLKGDITKVAVDAIINAANTSLLGGGGVDGAIHRAGGPEILDDCRAIRARQGGCKTGDAVITTAGRLPALRVIHTVGPRWRGGEHGEEELLANAYKNSMRLARDHNLKTLAFPSISTGVYKFPIERAARIALREIAAESEASPGVFDEIQIVLFDAPDLWIYQQARREVFASTP